MESSAGTSGQTPDPTAFLTKGGQKQDHVTLHYPQAWCFPPVQKLNKWSDEEYRVPDQRFKKGVHLYWRYIKGSRLCPLDGILKGKGLTVQAEPPRTKVLRYYTKRCSHHHHQNRYHRPRPHPGHVTALVISRRIGWQNNRLNKPNNKPNTTTGKPQSCYACRTY